MSKSIPVVTVETGVPIPDDSETRSLYPLGTLAVGDSFTVPIVYRASVQTAASKAKQGTDKDFTVRKVDNDNVRIWRTK